MKQRLHTHVLLRPILLAVAVFFLARSAQAVLVAPGDVAFLSGTTSAANPNLAGVVQSDLLLPFEIHDNLGNVLIAGNVQDRVVRSDNTGQMIFAPRLRDLSAPSGDAWILGLRLEGYGGFSTDIDFRTDGLGDVGADDVSRSVGDGDILTFRYDPNIIIPPDEALFLSIFTDATAYSNNGTITIFAQNDFGADVYSTTLTNTVSPAVPEPASLLLIGSGLVGILGLKKRGGK